MPIFVTRKKLKPGTIFDIEIELWGVWSTLDAMVHKKRLNRKIIHKCMNDIAKIAIKCEIRLPDRKTKLRPR